MRERLAAAFCGWDYADWQDFPLLDREVALRGVDRMLDVLREPNEAMLETGDTTDDYLFDDSYGHYGIHRDKLWKDMIDAILQEGE